MSETGFIKTLREVLRRSAGTQGAGPHPDAETIGAFLDKKLDAAAAQAVKAHIASCSSCADASAVALRLDNAGQDDVPAHTLERLRSSACMAEKNAILDIALKLKKSALELLRASGDILAGQEFVPAPVLRSRQTRDFPDTITVLKDFKDVRVEARLERTGAQSVSLTVHCRCVRDQACLKDARVTLLQGAVELESYCAASGSACFEHLAAGSYGVDISSSGKNLAHITLSLES